MFFPKFRNRQSALVLSALACLCVVSLNAPALADPPYYPNPNFLPPPVPNGPVLVMPYPPGTSSYYPGATISPPLAPLVYTQKYSFYTKPSVTYYPPAFPSQIPAFPSSNSYYETNVLAPYVPNGGYQTNYLAPYNYGQTSSKTTAPYYTPMFFRY